MAADARDQLAADETDVSWWVDVDPVAFASWLGVFVVIGVLRPRWTTLATAVVPLLIAGFWLVRSPDIGVAAMTWLDRAWLLGMAVAGAAACALACAIGVAARRLVGGPGGGPPPRRRWG